VAVFFSNQKVISKVLIRNKKRSAIADLFFIFLIFEEIGSNIVFVD
jgi:hypothetical protein